MPMTTPSPVATSLLRALAHPTRGVVGLVDDLLALCREHNLQVDWQADRCRVRACGSEWEELRDVTLRKSVFRAILARIAALCNEQAAISVSPYGGQAELSVGTNPPVVFRVAFANTPAEQTLELLPATSCLVSEHAASVAGTGELSGTRTETVEPSRQEVTPPP